MKLTGNTILITGGASGIGLSFTERFLKYGNKVIICGRRKEKLREAKDKYSELIIKPCDISKEKERISLFQWVKNEMPELNVLVNNAGIQQRIDLLNAKREWKYYEKEIITNFEAPVHLSMLFIPHLTQKDRSAIINVSSGLAFTPLAGVPVYSATKGALHSFTVSLRHQLSSTNVEVIEVVPPAVDTDLGGPGLHTFGVPVDEYGDGVFQGLEKGLLEIGYGMSEKALRMSRDEIDEAVKFLNNMKH